MHPIFLSRRPAKVPTYIHCNKLLILTRSTRLPRKTVATEFNTPQNTNGSPSTILTSTRWEGGAPTASSFAGYADRTWGQGSAFGQDTADYLPSIGSAQPTPDKGASARRVSYDFVSLRCF